MRHRTPAYWPTRILLVVGVIATVIAFALALTGMLAAPPMFGPEPTVLGLLSRVVQSALAIGLGVFGLAWMICIFRGARDEPPLGATAAADPGRPGRAGRMTRVASPGPEPYSGLR